MEPLSKYKNEIELIDKLFESKYKNYDPYIKFMKYYVKFKNGKIKRFGATNFYRPKSFYSQNIDLTLFSKNAKRFELKKNCVFFVKLCKDVSIYAVFLLL